MNTMEQLERISVQSFCMYHQVEQSFVESLTDSGLAVVIIESGEKYIDTEQLQLLEKLVRLHHDLEINFEGIEAIAHLLEKIDLMQHEITALRNRLSFYE
jgi:hypothetical protein